MGENAACYKRGEDFCLHLKYKRMPWSVALIGLCDDKSLRVTRSDSLLYGYDRDIFQPKDAPRRVELEQILKQ